MTTIKVSELLQDQGESDVPTSETSVSESPVNVAIQA